MNRLKSRYTLVLPIFLLTVHLVTICPPDANINYAYQHKSCNCKNLLLETWNIRFLNQSLQSPLLHNCSRTEVTWRLLGVEQSDAVQSVTRLLILRHSCLPSICLYCSSLLYVAHTKRRYFCRGRGGLPKERKEGCSFGRVNHWIYWSILKATCRFGFNFFFFFWQMGDLCCWFSVLFRTLKSVVTW